jgi:hypothetical protein
MVLEVLLEEEEGIIFHTLIQFYYRNNSQQRNLHGYLTAFCIYKYAELS